MRTGSLSLPLVEDDDAQQPRPQVRSASFCAAEIMHGIKHNQFEPFFQPEVELATGRVTGARASRAGIMRMRVGYFRTPM